MSELNKLYLMLIGEQKAFIAMMKEAIADADSFINEQKEIIEEQNGLINMQKAYIRQLEEQLAKVEP